MDLKNLVHFDNIQKSLSGLTSNPATSILLSMAGLAMTESGVTARIAPFVNMAEQLLTLLRGGVVPNLDYDNERHVAALEVIATAGTPAPADVPRVTPPNIQAAVAEAQAGSSAESILQAAAIPAG